MEKLSIFAALDTGDAALMLTQPGETDEMGRDLLDEQGVELSRFLGKYLPNRTLNTMLYTLINDLNRADAVGRWAGD